MKRLLCGVAFFCILWAFANPVQADRGRYFCGRGGEYPGPYQFIGAPLSAKGYLKGDVVTLVLPYSPQKWELAYGASSPVDPLGTAYYRFDKPFYAKFHQVALVEVWYVPALGGAQQMTRVLPGTSSIRYDKLAQLLYVPVKIDGASSGFRSLEAKVIFDGACGWVRYAIYNLPRRLP